MFYRLVSSSWEVVLKNVVERISIKRGEESESIPSLDVCYHKTPANHYLDNILPFEDSNNLYCTKKYIYFHALTTTLTIMGWTNKACLTYGLGSQL